MEGGSAAGVALEVAGHSVPGLTIALLGDIVAGPLEGADAAALATQGQLGRALPLPPVPGVAEGKTLCVRPVLGDATAARIAGLAGVGVAERTAVAEGRVRVRWSSWLAPSQMGC